MQFSIATIALFAATAIAVPTARDECSQTGTVKACCAPSGTLGGLLNLNVQCVAIPVLDILNQSCGSGNKVNCCKTDQNGLINVGGIGCSIL